MDCRLNTSEQFSMASRNTIAIERGTAKHGDI